MSDILILARTRMRNHTICVGALDMNTGHMVRPLTSKGRAFTEDAPWRVGDVWRVDSLPQRPLERPHLEDIRITRMNRIARIDDIHEWFQCGPFHGQIYTGPAEGLFDGTLTFEPFEDAIPNRSPRSARLDDGGRRPSMSLQLWETDRLLVRHNVRRNDEWQVRYIGGSPTFRGVSFSTKHVGDSASPIVIEKGSLVSLSLARWWPRPDRVDGRAACYLQLCDILAIPEEETRPTRRIEVAPAPW